MEVSLVHADLSLPSGLGQSHLQLVRAGPSPAEAVSVPQGRATLCHILLPLSAPHFTQLQMVPA